MDPYGQGFKPRGAPSRVANAMIYDKVPAASNEDAIRCLRRAIQINPNRLMHYIELGRAYAQTGDVANARLYLEKGLGMPCVRIAVAAMACIL